MGKSGLGGQRAASGRAHPARRGVAAGLVHLLGIAVGEGKIRRAGRENTPEIRTSHRTEGALVAIVPDEQ
jgi:hypothetical protein